jgi:2-dehydro-3-deoxygluconokinase
MKDTARETLLSLVPLCDIFLPALKKRSFCLGESDPHSRRGFSRNGRRNLSSSTGRAGSVAFTKEGTLKRRLSS